MDANLFFLIWKHCILLNDDIFITIIDQYMNKKYNHQSSKLFAKKEE